MGSKHHKKFVKKIPEISAIENLCSQKKMCQSSPKNFRGCYPLRPPIIPNFIEIGQTSLEKSVKSVTFSVLPGVFFVTDGQKRT